MKIIIFLLYSIKACDEEIFPNRRLFINPKTNYNDFSISSNDINNEIEFIVFNTSYSNQLVINLFSDILISYKASHYIFKPLNEFHTEYVYFKDAEILNYNLSFQSIFITFSSNTIHVNNLSLFESPICSKKEKVNLIAEYLQSDFYSLPKTTVSTVNVNAEFTFYEESDTNKKNVAESHAAIILSPNARHKFSQIKRKAGLAPVLQPKSFILHDSIEKVELLNDNSISEEISETYESYENSESLELSANSESLLTEKISETELSENSISTEKFESENSHETPTEESEVTSGIVISSFSSSEEEEEEPSVTPTSMPTPPYDADNSTNATSPTDYFLNSSLTILTLFNDKVEVFYEDQGNETIEANETGHLVIFTNSTSFTVKYEGDVYFLTSLNLNLFLTVECAIIFDQSWRVLESQILSNIIFYHDQNRVLTLMTDLDEVPYVTVMPTFNVRYVPERPNTESYCLCTKARLEQCVENKECFLYSVPIDHYYSSSSSAISDIAANSKPITINLYLTYTSFNDYHQFKIKPITRSRKNLNFISVVPSSEVNLEIYDVSKKKDINKVIVNCVDVSNVRVSLSYQNSIDTLILKNSPLMLSKPLEIRNFISDAFSLSRLQSNAVYIYECLAINRSELNSIGIKFILQNNATLDIQEISMFPVISLTQSQISFTGNEEEFSVGFSNACNILISERSRDNPTVTITSDVPYNAKVRMIMNFILENSLTIDFMDALPLPDGLLINFVPNQDGLTSLELIMPDSFDYNFDGYRIFPFGNISGNIDLILYSSETVRSFMNCLLHNDFSVSNLSRISMNFNDNLKAVTFYDESIVAKVADGIGYLLELQFDRLFITGQMTIISNSTDVIEMSLNYSDFINNTNLNGSLDFDSAKPGLTSKMQDFVLKSTSSESSIFLDDTFSAFMNNSVLSKIKIDHGTNNIELKSNLSKVPNIVVINDVAGVLYYAKLDYVNLTYSFNETDFYCFENEDKKSCNVSYDLINFRSGPNMTVSVGKRDIYVSQSQFLAENVTFIGNPFSFISKTISRCKYNFVDIPKLTIIPTENSSSFNNDLNEDLNSTMFAKRNEFLNSDFTFDENFDLDLFFKSIYAKLEIDASQFSLFCRFKFLSLLSTPIKFSFENGENVLFLVNHLKSDIASLSLPNPHVFFAADIFTLVDDDLNDVMIDFKSLSGSSKRISSSLFDSNRTNTHAKHSRFDASIANSREVLPDGADSSNSHFSTLPQQSTSPFVTSSLFVVHYSSQDVLHVSLGSKEIDSKFFFIMESNTSVNIHLDNSWFLAKNAEFVTFVIMHAHHKSLNETTNETQFKSSSNRENDDVKITVQTDLYEMPNISVVDPTLHKIEYVEILYQPFYDAKVSFIIFISLACAVTIISVVFLLMSTFCYEKFDVDDEKTPANISNGSRSHQNRKTKRKIAMNQIENISESIDGKQFNTENNNDDFNSQGPKQSQRNCYLSEAAGSNLSIALEDSF